MANHEKFVFEELSKSALVNASRIDIDNGIEELINSAVTEHIKKIVKDPLPFKDLLEEIKTRKETSVSDNEEAEDTVIVDKEQDANIEISDNSNIDIDEENSVNMSSVEEVSRNEDVDFEAIKNTSYNQGFNDAKNDMLQNHFEDERLKLLSLFQQKLSELCPKVDFDSEIASLCAESLTSIAKKLHLILPVDFYDIIRNGLVDKLSRFYEEGCITVKIHPEKLSLCEDILQSDEIPAKFKDNFKIVADDSIEPFDCIFEYKDTKLEYSREQLSEEIEKIIERLQNAA